MGFGAVWPQHLHHTTFPLGYGMWWGSHTVARTPRLPQLRAQDGGCAGLARSWVLPFTLHNSVPGLGRFKAHVVTPGLVSRTWVHSQQKGKGTVRSAGASAVTWGKGRRRRAQPSLS